jgi:hypothetical protein
MVQDFQKLETKFQTHSIQLKESTWLGFPRTWSRTSATFGVPIDARSLKSMYKNDNYHVSFPVKIYKLFFPISNETIGIFGALRDHKWA